MRTISAAGQYFTPKDAIAFLRKNGFKPETPRIWKKVENKRIVTARAEPVKKKVRVTIS